MEIAEAQFEKLGRVIARGRRIAPHVLAAAAAMVGDEDLEAFLCDVVDHERGAEWRVLLRTPMRLIYVSDTAPTELEWSSTFPGSEVPPSLNVASWAHPLGDVRLSIASVRARNEWRWSADLRWVIRAGSSDVCTVPLFDGFANEAAEQFVSSLIRVG